MKLRSSLKHVALIAGVVGAIPALANAATIDTWKRDATPTATWNLAANWVGGTNATFGTSSAFTFDNNVAGANIAPVGENAERTMNSLTFNSTSATYTFANNAGATGSAFYFAGTNPKLTNNSSNLQTFNFNKKPTNAQYSLDFDNGTVVDTGTAGFATLSGIRVETLATATVQGSGNFTIGGGYQGGAATGGTNRGKLVKIGTGILALNGNANPNNVATAGTGAGVTMAVNGDLEIGQSAGSGNAGIVRIAHPGALGAPQVVTAAPRAFGSTTIHGGDWTGSLEVAIGITLDEKITVKGRNATGIAVNNFSGASTLSGAITLDNSTGSNFNFGSSGTSGVDSLTVNSALTAASGNLNWSGSGDGQFDGAVSGAALALNKSGDGILTLSNTNAYGGNTNVTAGALLVNGTHTGGDYSVSALGTLGGTGSIISNIVVDGILSPGASIESLDITGNVTLPGTLFVEFDSDFNTIDLLNVDGVLDLTDGTISFADLGSGALTDAAYVFATYTSPLPAFPVTEVNVPAGYELDYQYLGNSIALVQIPEPSSLVLLGVAGTAILSGLRRRRNVANQ